jgi:hypothetical protein
MGMVDHNDIGCIDGVKFPLITNLSLELPSNQFIKAGGDKGESHHHNVASSLLSSFPCVVTLTIDGKESLLVSDIEAFQRLDSLQNLSLTIATDITLLNALRPLASVLQSLTLTEVSASTLKWSSLISFPSLTYLQLWESSPPSRCGRHILMSSNTVTLLFPLLRLCDIRTSPSPLQSSLAFGCDSITTIMEFIDSLPTDITKDMHLQFRDMTSTHIRQWIDDSIRLPRSAAICRARNLRSKAKSCQYLHDAGIIVCTN